MAAAVAAAARGLHRKEQQVHRKQRWRGRRGPNALVGPETPHCGPTKLMIHSSGPASSGEWLAVLDAKEYTWTGSIGSWRKGEREICVWARGPTLREARTWA